jgi:phage recombination protein Bet
MTTKNESNSLTQQNETPAIRYIPLGEKAPIELTLRMIAHDIATPTKSGKRPSEGDCLRFANLCKGRELNPWTGDCFMIGFDSQGGANFELITAYQALLKRAENSSAFDGIEGGVVVLVDGKQEHRKGCLVGKNEVIVGGWAKAYRQDRRIPHESVIDFKVYDTGRSRWAKDPAGMITKCAKAAALREAFPNQVGGLYLQEELDRVHEDAEMGAVMEPARIAAPVSRPARSENTVTGEVLHDQPQQTTDELTVEQPRDWAAEFSAIGVTAEAIEIRKAKTDAQRADVLKTVKKMVDEQQYDLLSQYVGHKNSGKDVA